MINITQLTNQAIKAALNQSWHEAIELNLTILEESPQDIPTLNRLGFAYTQQGEINQAKATYSKVLSVDKYNPIAQKSLEKLSKLKQSTKKNGLAPTRVFTSFLEEPGKTKTIQLIRPADATTIANVNAGTPVMLVTKKRRISIETQDGHYLGCLPDDIGFRLSKLYKLGYDYAAFVRSSQNKNVSIFIKEIKRAAQGNNLPSFPHSSQMNMYQLPKLTAVDESPIDITPTGEEDTTED